jgi:hypothetical protein
LQKLFLAFGIFLSWHRSFDAASIKEVLITEEQQQNYMSFKGESLGGRGPGRAKPSPEGALFYLESLDKRYFPV